MSAESGMAFNGSAHHLIALIAACFRLIVLERRAECRYKPNLIKPALLAGSLRRYQMTDMNRIERTAHYSNLSHRSRPFIDYGSSIRLLSFDSLYRTIVLPIT